MSSEIIKNHSHRPTFVDGYNNNRFKVIKDKNINKYIDWGMSADLELIANCCSEIDGVPERVVGPLQINKNMLIKFIGRVGFTRGQTQFDNNDAFFDKISSKISEEKIRRYYLEDLWK